MIPKICSTASMEAPTTETPIWLPQIRKYPGLAEFSDGGSIAAEISMPTIAAGLFQYSICSYILHRPANFGPLSVFAQPLHAYTFTFKPSPLVAICNLSAVTTLTFMASTLAGYNYRESALLNFYGKISVLSQDQ